VLTSVPPNPPARSTTSAFLLTEDGELISSFYDGVATLMTPLRVTLKRDLHLDHGVVLAGSKGRIYDSGRGDGSLCVRFDAERPALRHYAGELLLVPFDCEDVIDAFCVSPRDVLDTYGTLPPMAAMLEDVLDAVIELHGADFGNIQLYDEATGTLRIVAQRNFDQAFLDHFATVDAADGSCCGLALRSGARTVIEDVTTNPDFAPHRAIAASTGFRAVQSTPLVDQKTGKPLGMISTHWREPHRPTERELRLTDVYLRQALVVLASRKNKAAEARSPLTPLLSTLALTSRSFRRSICFGVRRIGLLARRFGNAVGPSRRLSKGGVAPTFR
jgi:hypothetical protein